VAVMFGGDSAEREISLKSGNAVLAALRHAGVDAHPFDPAERPLVALEDEGFERVFIALHGRGGEDGSLQGALDLMRVPYTGSGVLASALAMDKWRSKLCWQAADILVPQCVVLSAASDWRAVADRLGLPLFVKPASEGSSIGITKVRSVAELPLAYETAARHDVLVIAESFLSGGEFTVGILGGEALPVIRIVPATDFYDYDAKYFRDDTQYLIPSGLAGEREEAVRALALRAFEVLGGRGWGRIDIMLDGEGRPYCLEANMSPGMTDHSLVPMAARAAGLSFEALVLRVLEMAAHG
jgi:D-alanine-D-alanine ligase